MFTLNFKFFWDIARKNPYGFTFDIHSMSYVKYGYSVAYLETQDSFGKEGLLFCLNYALYFHDGIIGGWLNPSHIYQFDSVKIFTNQDRAMEFAIQNKQFSFYNLTEMTEIIV